MAKAKKAERQRPVCFKNYPNARWDLKTGLWVDGDYWFDEAAAQAAVDFFHHHICFTTGEWAGRPFQLEAWQEHDILRPLFGWKRWDADDRAKCTRRYRKCYIWLPRKNGKTEFAAGLALLMLLGDGEPGGQVFSIASEKDQATIVFEKATVMVSYSPSLTQLLDCLKPSIYCAQLNASFKPLSGKPQGKHGLNMSGLIGDEIHEWKTGDLHTFVHDSAAARRQPLEILISTAGTKGTHGEQVYDECVGILNGDIDAPDTMVIIYGAAPDDDWTDPEVHKRANPNWGISVKPDTFAADFRAAQQLPRLENDFKRYRLNMWAEQAVRWLPIASVDDDGKPYGWDYCIGPYHWADLEKVLAGKRCFGGLDLSAVNDISALAWWFPVQPGLDVPVLLPRFFKPRALLKAHGKRDRLPYERWDAEGALFGTPGNVVDYEFIRQQIYEDGQRFKIAHAGSDTPDEGQGSIAIDRWNAIETTVKLRQEGLPAVLFGQGFASMSAPSKELERLVLCNGFHHGGHPVLRQHAKVCAVEQDAAGNIKPSKEGSSQRIDGIPAGIMALGISLKDTGEEEEGLYEKLARQRREAKAQAAA